MSANLDFRLNAPQSVVYPWIKPGHTVVTPWGRGTGKSWYQRLIAYLLIAEYDGRRQNAPTKGVRVTWFMDTLKHWKKVHSDLLDAELNGPWKRLGAKIDHVDWTVRFPGGSIMQVFPAAEFRSQAGRGHRTDVMLPDEIDDIEISVFNAVAGPWFSEPWSLKMRLCGGTPRRGRYGLLYHLHKLGLNVDDPVLANFHSHHATYRDCPETVDRGVVEEARRTWHPAAFKREWECSFDSAEGLVYSLFDAKFHVKKPPKGTVFSVVLVGGDWGFTEPGVFLVVGITGHGDDAQAWLIEEHYETEKVIGEWTEVAKKIRERYPSARWYADPSQPSSIKTIGTDAHVNIVGADNRIPQGVACVADKLFVRGGENDRWARLYIHPGCTNTIRELGAYKRKQDPRDTESYTDEIIDRDNHCLIAGTMVDTSTGPVPIEAVRAGDMVHTRRGLRRVKWSGMTRQRAATHHVELSSGRTLDGTPDHLVWSQQRGWIRLDALRYSDTLEPCQTSMVSASESDSTASCSDDTRSRQTGSCESTTHRSTGGGYTARSGKRRMGRYPRVTTSTTGMTTRSITPSGILSARWQPSTSANTGHQSSDKPWLSASSASAHLQRSGTVAPRGALGTASMAKTAGPTVSRCRRVALSAAKSSTTGVAERLTGSAPTTAKPHGGGSLVSTTKSVRVLNAASRSPSTNTARPSPAPVRVVRSGASGKLVPVYDLTIDGQHEFYANGVLVHNSMDALRYLCMGHFGEPPSVRFDSEPGHYS